MVQKWPWVHLVFFKGKFSLEFFLPKRVPIFYAKKRGASCAGASCVRVVTVPAEFD